MSDKELEAIKRKRLLELQKRIELREKKSIEIDRFQLLNRIFRGRAWEVFNAASAQFPEPTKKVGETLANLAFAGKLKKVSGEELLSLFRSLGLHVRLETEIKFLNNGKAKSLSEKLKEKLSDNKSK